MIGEMRLVQRFFAWYLDDWAKHAKEVVQTAREKGRVAFAARYGKSDHYNYLLRCSYGGHILERAKFHCLWLEARQLFPEISLVPTEDDPATPSHSV